MKWRLSLARAGMTPSKPKECPTLIALSLPELKSLVGSLK